MQERSRALYRWHRLTHPATMAAHMAAREDIEDEQGTSAPTVAEKRTFAWLGRYRRLSKDYEYRTETSEAMIYAAMTQLMARRLARW